MKFLGLMLCTQGAHVFKNYINPHIYLIYTYKELILKPRDVIINSVGCTMGIYKMRKGP